MKMQQFVDLGELKLIEQAKKASKTSLMTFFGANVVLGIFSAGLIQYLWGMINTLQIIMLTSLFDLNFPLNANEVMTIIMQLCAMDVFDTDSIFIQIFGFRETKVFKSKLNSEGEEESAYANAGYDSSIYFMLLGPIFFIVLLYLFAVVIKTLMRLATKNCSENFLTKRLRSKSDYSVIIVRFILESCLEVGLSSIICVLMIEREVFTTFWESFSTVCAILSLIGLCVAPVLYYRLTKKYLEEVELLLDPSVSKNYRLFNAFRVNKPALMYQIIFFLRRYTMLISLTLVFDEPLWQVELQMASTMFIVYYITNFQPFYSPAMNRIEALNELTVLVASYPLLTFTEWVWVLEERKRYGWYLINCIGLSVLFNILVTLAMWIHKICRSLKFYCLRRRKLAEARASRLRYLQSLQTLQNLEREYQLEKR